MYWVVTTVNYIVLHIWKLLREYILQVLIARKKNSVTVYGDGCYQDFSWEPFHNIHKCWIAMFYTCNIMVDVNYTLIKEKNK